jgi:multidrug efflux pump subunit AcrA (membrane-fusion protein)
MQPPTNQRAHGEEEPRRRGLFRAEAVEALERPSDLGRPLQLLPHWTGWLYGFLTAAVSVGVVYVVCASISEYAEGPAIVRVDGRTDVTTPMGGVVSEVAVRSGQRVQRGQVLVRLQTEAEQQELERIDRELELKVVRLLLHPSDESTRQSLSGLRASRQQAEARLRQRGVIAPARGVVANLRSRPGQMLAPGDTVLTLLEQGEGAGYSVVALLPGQWRPMLRRGMNLRFALAGYPHLYQSMPITTVGDEVIGPNEARRYLGRELEDTVAVQGSLVLVTARVPAPSFLFEGQRYRYYDGIPARVEVRVRSTRMLLALFPALRRLFHRGG